ncbi:MAG TPA: flagellar biosynthesis repressor FlbT [Hyphomicrobium sp.]|nr:flagellar biosynthesis repressor FlbT [Hyphomicrobium sp.]
MSTLKISLRAGERIFINGAVLRVDRKVTLEVLNNVTFLLEHHVMKPEDTVTPLRQLYFMIQTAIMEPNSAQDAIAIAHCSLRALKAAFASQAVLADLAAVEELLERQRYYESLRILRKLFAIEDRLMGRGQGSNELTFADDAASRQANRQIAACR